MPTVHNTQVASTTTGPVALRRRQNNPYDLRSVGYVHVCDGKELPTTMTGDTVPPVPPPTIPHAHIVVGQVNFNVTAEDLRALFARFDVRVVAASNIRPKGFRGKLQSGLWNVFVAPGHDALASEAVHNELRFASATMCADSGNVAFAPADAYTLHMGTRRWDNWVQAGWRDLHVRPARSQPKNVQVELPKQQVPDFLLATTTATAAVAA